MTCMQQCLDNDGKGYKVTKIHFLNKFCKRQIKTFRSNFLVTYTMVFQIALFSKIFIKTQVSV